MLNSFPRPIHSDLVGGPCRKGLADDHLTEQKQSWCIHRRFVPTEQAQNKSHTHTHRERERERERERKLDNHRAI